jgi:acetyl-CoA carboxylase carboxyltransferase component
MDRIKLLQTRRQKLLDSGKEIRAKIASICDESSFVEFDSYSFSRNEYYGEDAQGEGIVSGYAQINDYPVIVIAQNSQVLGGGLSLASCKKMVKAMQKALEGEIPVLYLLDSKGVQVGEGVNVLEGIGEILDAQSSLRDASIPQISVVLGEVYGSLAILATSSDFCYLVKGGCITDTSSGMQRSGFPTTKDIYNKDCIRIKKVERIDSKTLDSIAKVIVPEYYKNKSSK